MPNFSEYADNLIGRNKEYVTAELKTLFDKGYQLGRQEGEDSTQDWYSSIDTDETEHDRLLTQVLKSEDVVQVKNPKTGRYTVIDKCRGLIVGSVDAFVENVLLISATRVEARVAGEKVMTKYAKALKKLGER